MADDPKVEPEIIEIVENVLDNQMFALAVAAGVVGGAILAYLYFTREKGSVVAPKIPSYMFPGLVHEEAQEPAAQEGYAEEGYGHD